MIGFQYLIRERKIVIVDLAKEVGVHQSTIFDWIRKENVPKKHRKFLAEKFDVNEEYLVEKVNNINTYIPKGTKNNYTINGDTTIYHITRRNGEKFDVLIDTNNKHIFDELNLKIHVGWHSDIKGYYAEICQYLGMVDGKAKYKTLLVHRLVMNEQLTKNKVDHKSHNTLDNRENNLRVTVQDKNLKHRKGRNSNNKSGHRNVSWHERDNCWAVQLQIKGKNTILKRFPFEQLEEAGVYAEKMRLKYYGEFAGNG